MAYFWHIQVANICVKNLNLQYFNRGMDYLNLSHYRTMVVKAPHRDRIALLHNYATSKVKRTGETIQI
jgi:hypothetical protein